MPKNRGKEGRDDYLFGEAFMQRKIKEAVFDMSFLLERGYGESSSCELVGNRYKLNKRQQQAIKGMSAAVSKVETRKRAEVLFSDLKDQTLIIDGFNQLILFESFLSEAYIFKGQDGAYRDLSSLHGTYKSVNQTNEAIQMFADFFKDHQVKKVIWVFDKPVSNSGRMKTKLEQVASENNYEWEVLLDNNPDKMIANSKYIAITSDAWILDRSNAWCNILDFFISDEFHLLLISC